MTPVPGSSGIPAPLYSAAGYSPDEAQGATLSQVAAAKFDRDGNAQGALPNGGSATSASLAYGQDRDYSQLANAAGIGPDDAAGMSFVQGKAQAEQQQAGSDTPSSSQSGR